MSEYEKKVEDLMKNRDVIKFQEALKSVEFIFEATKSYKNATKSEEIRKKGNIMYTNNDIFEAIKLYTESIAYGPLNSDALAKAYGNRSAALVEGGLYKECIEDINNAYQHGYSKTEEKLLLRLAFCQYMLYEETELNNTIKKILSVSKTYKDENEIMDELKLRPRKDPFVTYLYRKPPPLSYGPSEEVPCASSAVKIAFDNANGQHLVATQDIKIGDVLIVEKPHSFALLEIARYYHCSHCMKFCLRLIPCEHCVWAMFCSTECKILAKNEYHKLECSIGSKYSEAYSALKNNTNVFFPPDKESVFGVIRSLCKTGPDKIKDQLKIISHTKNVKKTRTGGFVNGIYDPANIETMLTLPLGLFSHLPSNNALSVFAITSIVLEKCFNATMKFDPKGFITLCLKLQLVHEVNSFATKDRDLENNKEEIFCSTTSPIFSLATTSCYANSTSMVYGNMKVAYSCLPIKQGGLITRTSSNTLNNGMQLPKGLISKFKPCQCEACLKKININDFGRPSDLPVFHMFSMQQLNTMLYDALKDVKISPNEELFMQKVNAIKKKHTDFINEYDGKHHFDPVLITAYFTLMDCLYFSANYILFKE